MQHSVGEKGPTGVGQDSLIFGEPHGAEGSGRKHHRLSLGVRRITNQHPPTVVAQQLVQGVDQVALATEVQPQAAQVQLVEANVGQAAEPTRNAAKASRSFIGGDSRSGDNHCAADTVSGQSTVS